MEGFELPLGEEDEEDETLGDEVMDEEEGEDVEPSEDEVMEFLAELESKPIVKPTPEGTVALDPMETDAKTTLDAFKEMRMVPNRRLIYERGMPDQQMMITLKDRLTMIAEFADTGNWQRSRFLMRGIWRKKRLRLPLGRILWNLMIKAHARANRPKAAESWVVDMLDRVYQPDRISYNTLLHAFARRGDHLKVTEWMRKMRARGVKPDHFSFAAAANAFANAESLEGAEETVREMIAAGFGKESPIPYNAVLKICAQRGLDAVAESWYGQMVENKCQPDKVTFLLLMKSCGSDSEGAGRWLEEMQQRGLSPGREHFHSVMTAHARNSDIGGVEAWMRVMADQRLEPGVYSFNIMLSACAQAGNTKAAEGIVELMLEEGLRLDTYSYSAMMGTYAEAGDPEGALRWLYRAERDGLEPNLKCYNRAIKAFARAGNSTGADHLARRLMRNWLTPDAETYGHILAAFSQDGSPATAEFWVDHMMRQARWKHREFPQHRVAAAYADALLAHVRTGNLEAGEAWLTTMLNQGVEPNAACYSALARAHLEEGRPAQAQLWVDRMSSWSALRPPKDLAELLGRGQLPAGGAREREPLDN